MDVILFLQLKDSDSNSLKIGLWVKDLNLIVLSKNLSTLYLFNKHRASIVCSIHHFEGWFIMANAL